VSDPSAAARRPPIVIGLGNTYAHDDGVGPAVAAAFAAEAPPGVTVVELDGEPARVVESWDGSPLAIVVDASRSGATPGTVSRLATGDLARRVAALPPSGPRSSSHALGVAEAVELGRVLGRLPVRLVVLAVEGVAFGPGPGLSDAVAAAVPGVVSAIVGELCAPDARLIEVTGVVQGVGFRPFVWRLAHRHGISGWVRNQEGNVEIHAEGPFVAVEAFTASLATDAPPLARVHDVREAPVEGRRLARFTIEDSVRAEVRAGDLRHVPPDSAPCAACRSELEDPADRRFGHPFVNCTDCGPRFTVIEALPYDRSRTSMAAFEMCERCAAEYVDPADRRFHAEPVACHDCGPQIRLVDRNGTEVVHAADAIERSATLLRAGRILAVKGVGGYQLACDATDARTVGELRRRKQRPDKPLAVMVTDLDMAHRLAGTTGAEDELLASPATPIVLVDGRDELPEAVAPGHVRLGLVLPASPLHHLLSRAAGRPLVLTSGNRSDEPIAIDDADALDRLAGIADAWLTHDRRITTRLDDSVMAWRGPSLGPVLLRRARGHAPGPLALGAALRRSVLAVGADLGNSFCLAAGREAFVSAHIGDLDDDATIEAWRLAVDRQLSLVGLRPDVVAHDAHPDLHSTRLAERLADDLGIGRFAVRHHHAHVASVIAEHGLVGPVLGLAFDGFGLGDDGTAWGGEFLVVDAADGRRVGHLAVVSQPGGDLAVRHPARMALAHADAAGCRREALGLLGLDPTVPADLLGGVDAERLLAVGASTGGVPVTSSIGRLFDAIAALCGLGTSPSYEGQPAMLLEQAARPAACADLGVVGPGFDMAGESMLVLDPAPVVRSVVADLAAGRPVVEVAAGFHRALADAVVDAACVLASREGITDVCLAGGVWANGLLVELVAPALVGRGLHVYLPSAVPPGDGGLALGQALVAGSVSAGVS
jgi:hydrogenase maturation protein HypF